MIKALISLVYRFVMDPLLLRDSKVLNSTDLSSSQKYDNCSLLPVSFLAATIEIEQILETPGSPEISVHIYATSVETYIDFASV
jgi:hypothetical protein